MFNIRFLIYFKHYQWYLWDFEVMIGCVKVVGRCGPDPELQRDHDSDS